MKQTTDCSLHLQQAMETNETFGNATIFPNEPDQRSNSMSQLSQAFFVIFSLVLNLYVCLMYKMCLFWIVFHSGSLTRNPVNAMTVIDETFRMIPLFCQSAMVYIITSGQTFRWPFSRNVAQNKLALYCTTSIHNIFVHCICWPRTAKRLELGLKSKCLWIA